jgi:hypothetical protein
VIDITATDHVPVILVGSSSGGLASHFIVTQTVTNTSFAGSTTFGTVAIHLIVDSGNTTLSVLDSHGGGVFSFSGYLLPLTTGASC